MGNDHDSQIRLAAFSERAANTGGPVLLQVYIINESPAMLRILSDLDSISVPERPAHGSEAVHDADLVHIDFGESGSGEFVQVAPGECVKVTLVLREEQVALLDRARYMKTTVKSRAGGDEKGEVTTVLLPAVVYKTN